MRYIAKPFLSTFHKAQLFKFFGAIFHHKYRLDFIVSAPISISRLHSLPQTGVIVNEKSGRTTERKHTETFSVSDSVLSLSFSFPSNWNLDFYTKGWHFSSWSGIISRRLTPNSTIDFSIWGLSYPLCTVNNVPLRHASPRCCTMKERSFFTIFIWLFPRLLIRNCSIKQNNLSVMKSHICPSLSALRAPNECTRLTVVRFPNKSSSRLEIERWGSKKTRHEIRKGDLSNWANRTFYVPLRIPSTTTVVATSGRWECQNIVMHIGQHIVLYHSLAKRLHDWYATGELKFCTIRLQKNRQEAFLV